MSLTTAFACALFVALLVALFRSARPMFWASALLLLQFVWILASVIYIETQPSMLLVSTWSLTADVGATAALALHYSLFLVGMLVVGRMSGRRLAASSTPPDTVKVGDSTWWWTVLSLAVTVLLLINALLSPNAITSSGVRASFYRASALPFASEINVALPLFMAVAGFIAARYGHLDHRLIRVSLFTLLTAIITAYLSGVEFSGYLLLLVSYALPFAMTDFRGVNLRRRRRIAIFAVVGAVVAAAFKLYSFVGATNYTGVTTGGLSSFIYRALGLQGEVFWKTFSLYADNPQPSQLANELGVLLHELPDTSSGIYVLMEHLVPGYSGVGDFTLNSGYPAILIFIFGYSFASLAICLLGGVLFGVIARIYVVQARGTSALSVFASYGVLNSTYLAFTMGGTLYFAATTMIICVTLLVLIGVKRLLDPKRNEALRAPTPTSSPAITRTS